MSPTGSRAASGLSPEDVTYWLPRLPAGLDDAAIAGKLRQIAALREPEAAVLGMAAPRTPRPSRQGGPGSAERRARFEEKRRMQPSGRS